MRALALTVSVAVFSALFAADAFAVVSVYLVSRAELGEAPVLGDVASIDGPPEARKALLSLSLPEKLLADGYVDRREVEELAAAVADEVVLVYGNAARVSRKAKEDAVPSGDRAAEIEFLVAAGEAALVRVKKNGIVIELSGSALENGASGDEVTVRLKGNRTLKGRVVEKGLVELTL